MPATQVEVAALSQAPLGHAVPCARFVEPHVLLFVQMDVWQSTNEALQCAAVVHATQIPLPEQCGVAPELGVVVLLF